MLGSEVAQPSPWYSMIAVKVWNWMDCAYALAIAGNVTIALACQPSKQQAIWEANNVQIEVQCAWLDTVSYVVQTHSISCSNFWFCFFAEREKGPSPSAGQIVRKLQLFCGLFETFTQFKVFSFPQTIIQKYRPDRETLPSPIIPMEPTLSMNRLLSIACNIATRSASRMRYRLYILSLQLSAYGLCPE